MPVLSVDSAFLQKVTEVSKWNQQPPADLLTCALDDYIDKLEWERLSREMKAFEAMLGELLKEYDGKYVAIHAGKVVGVDDDLMTLHNRIYCEMESVPVLFERVTTEPKREIIIRSSRVEWMR
ncbi:MAG: hypothetical protein HY328_01300 [Chloroflexi bacterium]|nr:hypothetical protein [Chloroflexota bacterium]